MKVFPGKTFRVWLPWIFLLVLAPCQLFVSAETLERQLQSSQFFVRNWQTDEGLPDNSVQAIAQDAAGYLWLGTQNGLERFDGARFVIFDRTRFPEITNNWINTLCATRDGALWCGAGGGNLLRFKRGHFTNFRVAAGLDGSSILNIVEDAAGTVWIGSVHGVSRYRDGKFLTIPGDADLLKATVRNLALGRDGMIWAATTAGLYGIKNDSVAVRFTTREGLPSDTVRSVYEDSSGVLWIGTMAGLIRKEKEQLKLITMSDGLGDNIVSTMYEDRKGNFWIGTFGGLNRVIDGKLVTERNSDNMVFDIVYSIFEDNEENLWLGSRAGLCRLQQKQFIPFTQQQGLSHNNVISIMEDSKTNLWIGTWGGGLNSLKNGVLTNWTSSQVNQPIDLVLSLLEDHSGTLWLGTDYESGLFHFAEGKWTRYAGKAGLYGHATRVLYEDRQHRLWVGTSNGLNLMSDGKFTAYTVNDGLAGAVVRAIIEDDSGALWIGTETGLSRFAHGKFENFTTANGLSHNVVVALFLDEEKSLWIGTKGGGLNRFEDGKFKHYANKNGLFDNSILEILQDDYGSLWMTSPHGVFRVRKKDFDDFDRGTISRISSISYGKSEGLLSTTCIGTGKPAAWKTKDGRLWFPTAKGLVVTDPKIVDHIADISPPVIVEEVFADKKPLTQSSGADIPEVEPGRGDFEIHYTALSYRAPEKIHFRYKLDGVDADWVDAETRRTAYYNNVPPGRHSFKVMASNEGSDWNTQTASVEFILLPHFRQTWWFQAVIVLSAVLVVAGTVRYITYRRWQRRLEGLERQHAIERERSRIAKDMHDELGANLTQISLLGELVKKQSDEPKRVLLHAEKITETARELVQGMDEIVWAVNPKNDNLRRLAGYIFQFGEEFFALTNIRCRLERPAVLPELAVSAEVRHNLFLTVKETLNNIVKHSCATEVWLRLSLAGSRLELTVEDNGRGFSNENLRQFGNGITNIQKRMEEVGGSVEISSAPGKGTRVKISVGIATRHLSEIHPNGL